MRGKCRRMFGKMLLPSFLQMILLLPNLSKFILHMISRNQISAQQFTVLVFMKCSWPCRSVSTESAVPVHRVSFRRWDSKRWHPRRRWMRHLGFRGQGQLLRSSSLDERFLRLIGSFLSWLATHCKIEFAERRLRSKDPRHTADFLATDPLHLSDPGCGLLALPTHYWPWLHRRWLPRYQALWTQLQTPPSWSNSHPSIWMCRLWATCCA